MKKKILVPLDNSSIAKELIEVAKHWKKKLDAELTFMHVGSDKIDQEAQYKAYLDFLSSVHDSVEHQVSFQIGTPYLEIVKEANSLHPDLIIMGAHSHFTLGRMFLGSNTDYVIHHVESPIYVHKISQQTLPQKILVPIDYTPINKTIVKMADTRAQATGAELLLVRVDSYPESHEYFGLGVNVSPQLVREMEAAHEVESEECLAKNAAQLEHFVDNCKITSPHRHFSMHGKPYEKIMEVIRTEGAELIMMAAHSHTLLDRVINGSTTDYLLHHAPCPLYVFKFKPE